MARVLDGAWRRLNDALFRAVGPERYARWIRNVRPAWLDEETLVVHVGSGFARDKMERLYLQPATEAARRATNRNLRVRFEADGDSFPVPSPVRLREEDGGGRPTFRTFVPGPGNRMALGAAQAFVEGFPGARSILFCAASGLGKTHLLRAIEDELGRRGDGPLLHFSGEQFRRHFTWAFQRGHAEAFLEKCRRAPVFLLDGLHLLAGRPEAVEALEEVLAEVDARGGRTAVASDLHPRQSEGLRGRFRARIETSIGAPDPATSRAVLAARAPQGTPASALEAIARAVTSSHKDQLFCLARVLELGPATAASVRAVVGEFLNSWSRGLTYADVVRAVAASFGVSAGEIYSDDRSRPAADARQACYWLARRVLGEPFARIGDHFGGRDHSTVLEACRKLDRRRSAERERLRRLEAALKEGVS